MPQRTLVFFEFAANAAKSADFQKEHLAYVLELLKSGKAIAAGPLSDGRSAAILFATKDWDEAEALIEKEPFNARVFSKLPVTAFGPPARRPGREGRSGFCAVTRPRPPVHPVARRSGRFARSPAPRACCRTLIATIARKTWPKYRPGIAPRPIW